MKKKQLTQDEVIALLRKRQGERTNVDFAEELGIDKQKLWNIYNKKQLPDKTIGFAKIKYYLFEEVRQHGSRRVVREAEAQEASSVEGAV